MNRKILNTAVEAVEVAITKLHALQRAAYPRWQAARVSGDTDGDFGEWCSNDTIICKAHARWIEAKRQCNRYKSSTI